MKRIALALALAFTLPATALAQQTNAGRYGTSEALSVQNARLGEVLMVREVQIQNDRRLNSGSAIGAAVGYGVARNVDGDYRNAARVAGSVIGGVAGTAAQRALSTRRAYEVYVRDLSDRQQRVQVIVQEMDGPIFAGDKVFLVGPRNRTRVVRIEPQAGVVPHNLKLFPSTEVAFLSRPLGGGLRAALQ